VLLVLYYWLVYDTTVAQYPGSGPELEARERVYNIGRMLNRLVGTMVGLGFFAGGIALRFLDKKKG
jgi:hypothetical protein